MTFLLFFERREDCELVEELVVVKIKVEDPGETHPVHILSPNRDRPVKRPSSYRSVSRLSSLV